MKIAVTGATGFIGRYIVRQLLDRGHACRCSYRAGSDLDGIDDRVEWFQTELNDGREAKFLAGCDGVVHAALYHPGGGFRGGEGALITFVEKNVLGSLRLMQAAEELAVGRFVFVSTCAVHERILDDRRLDENHPCWSTSHYGAHKAAIEAFVYSFGLGQGFPVCALRPTGVYGVTRPISDSKWYDLIAAVVRGETVTCRRGGKEVHAADVARAAELLLRAEGITGEAFNCYDRYVSEFEVATLAREISGSDAEIRGEATRPKHQIETGKISSLGMTFGGEPLLRRTVEELIAAQP